MITIIDYGIVNSASVANAFEKLGIPFQIANNPAMLTKAKAILLPGVGAAGQGMKNLKERGFDRVIIDEVKKGKPILGICLGMQLLLSSSEEGDVQCLGLIQGKVRKFQTKLKVPQVGWNNVNIINKSKILKNIPDNSYFYFVNSYYCNPEDTIVKGQSNYDKNFCCVFEKNNIYGAQFHPEKSANVGLQVLKNYWEAVCR